MPVKDSDALAVAMKRFIREPKLAERMGNASLKLARNKYDVHKVNTAIIHAMGLQ